MIKETIARLGNLCESIMENYVYEDKLQSERLITSKLILDDAKAWSVFFEEPECIKFLPDYNIPDNTDRAIHGIERQTRRYENKQFGLQKLNEKQTGEFVGMCGLILQDVDGKPEIEVGYHLFKKYWGKGYAAEAAQLFKNYVFKNKLSPSVVSIIHAENERSKNVALKNGMLLERQMTWSGLEACIFRITNPEH